MKYDSFLLNNFVNLSVSKKKEATTSDEFILARS